MKRFVIAFLLASLAASVQVANAQARRAERGGPELTFAERIRTSVQPKSVELSPDGRTLWVCNFGRLSEHNVYVYDAETYERLAIIEFPGNAVETAFHPNGRVAYVSNFRRGVVEVIDRETYEVTREIEVGLTPKFMALSPSGHRLYVALYAYQRIAVVDPEAGEVIRWIQTGVQPRGMVTLSDGRVLVASFRSDRIQILNAEGREQRRFSTCPFPRHLQLSPDEETVYVTCTLGSISGYSIETGRRILYATTGGNPRTLAISEDGRFLATANFRTSDVTVLDVQNMVRRTYEVPNAERLVGAAMSVRGGRLRIFLTSWRNRSMMVMQAPLTEPVPADVFEDLVADESPAEGSAGESDSDPTGDEAPPVPILP